jgi:hypothetical protein
MDRITHQSPRQRGYGITSSLWNNSLKHTRKHVRRNGGIEPRNKALRLWRTVRLGGADRPACCRGLSAHTPWTVRPCVAVRPKKQTEPPETTPNIGPSAGSTRTVRQAPADGPHGTRGPSETSPNENSKPRWIETKGEQEHEEHLTNRDDADCPPGPRGPSARCRPSRKHTNLKVNSPKSSSDFPNGRSYRYMGLGTWKASHKDAIAQKSCLLTL